MGALTDLDKHDFVREVLEEGVTLLPDIDVPPDAVEMPGDVELDEQQYYVKTAGFYLVHMLAWCRQLDLSVELLSNFNYSKNINASRADHLIYNLENYLIRVNSVYDRVLQLSNAVFHLCISEENVGHSVVISNYKVKHRPEVVKRIKAIKKYLKDYEQTRHTLVHKHSLLDVKMRRIELFYMGGIEELPDGEQKKQLKSFRSVHLRDFVSEKKHEFDELNCGLAEKIEDLFSGLHDEYKRQVIKLN